MASRSAVPPVESLRPSGSLTFLAPSDDPTTSPSDPLSEPTSPSDPWADGSPSLSDESSDEPSAESGTSRRSSTGSSGSALSKRTLRDAARAAVLGAGGIAHEFLAQQEAQQQVGLYLADEQDAEAIGDPLASIAHRHGGIGGAANPDLGDAIAAIVGLAVYVSKQLGRAREARRLRAQAAERVAVPEDLGEAVDDPYSAS